MDGFNPNSQRPAEGNDNAYYKQYGAYFTPVPKPMGTPVTIVNVDGHLHTNQKGVTREWLRVACLLPGNKEFVTITLYGNVQGTDNTMNPFCWDFCYLAERDRPGCWKDKRTYTPSYDGKLHTEYTGLVGINMYLVFVDLGQTSNAKWIYTGRFFDFKTHMSVNELLTKATEAKDVTTKAVEGLQKEHNERAQNRQTQYAGPTYGQAVPAQQTYGGQTAQVQTYGAQTYGQAAPAQTPAAPAAVPEVDPIPF